MILTNESSNEIEGVGKGHQGSINPQPAVFLDPWLTCEGDALRRLRESLMLALHQPISGRTRGPRRDAVARKEAALSNIVANLAAFVLSPHHPIACRLAVATAKTKADRYDRAPYPRHLLAPLLNALEEVGALTQYPYAFRHLTKTVQPTADFVNALHSNGVRLADIGRTDGMESLWLNARTGESHRRNGPLPKCLVPYDDTEETIRLRGEVERINTFLNASRLTFDGEPQGPIALRRMFLLRSIHDAPTWNLNGRLHGGWWQSLKSSKRHLVAIDGEPIVDLDWVGMFVQLAYLRATGRPPSESGDPYAVPGLEGHRDGAKQGLIMLLSRSTDLRLLAPKLKELLPQGWTARRFKEAMARRHPAIEPLFGTDVGVELMVTESRLLMALLLELETHGIPALPMHDGINVRASHRERALELMGKVSRRELGFELPAREKPIDRPAPTMHSVLTSKAA